MNMLTRFPVANARKIPQLPTWDLPIDHTHVTPLYWLVIAHPGLVC